MNMRIYSPWKKFMNIWTNEYIRLNILEYIRISEYLSHTALAEAFFALGAKKELIILFWPIFGFFWSPVITLVTFSSNISNNNNKTTKSKKKKFKNSKKFKKSKNSKKT